MSTPIDLTWKETRDKGRGQISDKGLAKAGQFLFHLFHALKDVAIDCIDYDWVDNIFFGAFIKVMVLSILLPLTALCLKPDC